MSASGSGSSFNPVDETRNFFSRYGTLERALIAGIGGIIGTVLIGFSLFADAMRRLFTEPLNAMATGIGGLMDAIIGGAADIVQTGAVTTQQALLPGSPWAVGPLTFAFGVLAMGAGWYAFAWLLARASTSDTIPFTATDLPLIGAEEEDDDD